MKIQYNYNVHSYVIFDSFKVTGVEAKWLLDDAGELVESFNITMEEAIIKMVPHYSKFNENK